MKTLKIEQEQETSIEASFSFEQLVLTFNGRHFKSHQILSIEEAKKLAEFILQSVTINQTV